MKVWRQSAKGIGSNHVCPLDIANIIRKNIQFLDRHNTFIGISTNHGRFQQENGDEGMKKRLGNAVLKRVPILSMASLEVAISSFPSVLRTQRRKLLWPLRGSMRWIYICIREEIVRGLQVDRHNCSFRHSNSKHINHFWRSFEYPCLYKYYNS